MSLVTARTTTCSVCAGALRTAIRKGGLRPCIAGPSRVAAITPARGVATLPVRPSEPVPFFGQAYRPTPPAYLGGSQKRSSKGNTAEDDKEDYEKEVGDGEWELRVARAMIHLRETLPHLFDPQLSSTDLFPPDIYSRNVVLKLPAPLPLTISSLAGYGMAYTVAKSGLSAFHTDLHASLDRLTFSSSPAAAQAPAASFFTRRVPAYRHKQIRVLLSITGNPRLPPHKETHWHTSSLYTFSPYSGLICSHEVETIRPLPGEGVADWLMSRLLGWTGRHGQWEGGAVPAPSGVSR